MYGLIISYIREGGSPSSGDIKSHLEGLGYTADRTTIFRHLKKAENLGDITHVGEGSGTRYIDNNLDVYLSNPARPLVSFTMERLEYSPFFTASELLDFEDEREAANMCRAGSTYPQLVLQTMIIDLSFGSSYLEGNTYSLLDTVKLIEQGIEKEGGRHGEARMVLNHKDAIKIVTENENVNMFTLHQIHSALMFGLLQPQECGIVRGERVGIRNARYMPPKDRETIVAALEKVMLTLKAIEHPIEQSMYLLTAIPYIQPYIDGNKRMGRLTMNMPLIHNGFPPMSFKTMDKDRYIQAIIAFYEVGNKSAIKSVFKKAYAGSGIEYQVREKYEEPRELLAYQKEFRASLRDIFLFDVPVEDALVKYGAPLSLADEARRMLNSLHEGNVNLFNINRNEYLDKMGMSDNKDELGM